MSLSRPLDHATGRNRGDATTMRDRPPPLPDECPPVSYEIEVTRSFGGLRVRARLTHRMPDGTLKPGLGSMNSPDDLTLDVYEPNWFLRLLGDTTEARVERAKRRVARRAEREIVRDRRIASVAERYA